MAIDVAIPSNLRQHTAGETKVSVSGISVREALEELFETHPDLRDKLIAADWQPHSFVNFFVQGRNIRQLDGLQTPVRDGDTLLIVPALAGG